MADLNIKMTIAMIKKRIDIPITDEEIDYYVKYHRPSKIQTLLVYSYYTKYFGTYRDLNLLTRRNYMELLILLKKKLLLELGYYDEEEQQMHYASLPYLLTGNLSDKVNTRVIRNNKFISKIEENEMYNHLIDDEYNLLEEIKPETIISLLSSFINTRFTYVVYEQPELLGEEIFYSENKVSDELLFFLNML